jgi:tRNA threonylcarbamoyladenosine biosynthesis protein TsaB
MLQPLHLIFDTGSPVVSVALARGGAVIAARAVAMERSSGQLLTLVREVLEEAGARPADLGGVAALQGPGSFTGLRIGLATVLGLHQALGMPATALPTLRALAAALPASVEKPGPAVVLAVVDALRGDWTAQAFAIDGAGALPEALGEPALVPGASLPDLARAGTPQMTRVTVTGFGVSRLADLPGWPADLPLVEAGALAPAAARLAADPALVWDAALLTSPLYARPPAITTPRRRIAAA